MKMAKTETITRTDSVRARKPKTSKIKVGPDGNANTKAYVNYARDTIAKGYDQLLRVLNGKVFRTVDDKQVEYPLAPMSEERLQYIEDKLAALHATVMEQLRAGRRMMVVDDEMPE